MKIKTIVSCIIMCILVLIGVQVNAALEASAIATCEREVEAGDTITLDLSINVKSSGTGVEAIMATIEYPDSELEMSIVPISGMDVVPDGNSLIIAPDEPIKSGSKQIAKIKFTVSEDTILGSFPIKITEITAVDGDGTEKSLTNISKTITIRKTGAPVATLTEIVITKPSKTTIKAGEKLDVSCMKVTAKYSDGKTKDVTKDCEWFIDDEKITTFEGHVLTEGKHTIKAVYYSQEDSFDIEVEKTTTSTGGSSTGGSTTGGDNTTANKVIDKAGLEIITIPGIILAIAFAVISYKKYRMF